MPAAQTSEEILEQLQQTAAKEGEGGDGAAKPADGGAPKEGDGAAAAAAAAAGDGAGAATEVFFEEFDLGGGKTVRFEAETPEALRDKIVAGYRDLANKAPAAGAAAAPAAGAGKEGTPAAPAAPAPVKKGRKLTQDEEFAFNQNIKAGNPLEEIRKWIQTEYGMTLEEIADSAREGGTAARDIARYQREEVAVNAFREKHPDYPGLDQRSIGLVRKYLMGREATVETLEEAYAHFGEVLRPAAAPAAAGAGKEGGAQPGAAAVPGSSSGREGAQPGAVNGTVTRKPASAIFGKTGAAHRPAAAAAAKKEPTQKEMEEWAAKGSEYLREKLEEYHSAR